MRSAPETPTLRTERLRLRSASGELSVGDLSTSTGSLACLGQARALVQAFIEPERVSVGRLLCAGLPPQRALAELVAGYVPRRLVAEPSLRVREALLLGGRAVGLGKGDIDQALEQAHAGRFGKTRLGELTNLQQRLVGLAHGLCGSPSLLVLEDPYLELDEEGAAALEELYEGVLETRRFLTTIEADSPFSRSLLARSAQVLLATGGHVVGPFSPTELPERGLWVVCQGEPPQAWLAALHAAEAQVTPTPRPGVLFVRGLSGRAVLEISAQSGVVVRELSPVG